MARPILDIDEVHGFEFAQAVLGGGFRDIFTVPAGELWQFVSAGFRYEATATVGNRFVGYQLRNAADAILVEDDRFLPYLASQVTFHGVVAPDDFTGVREVNLASVLIPALTLPAGYTFALGDTSGVDANDLVGPGTISVRRRVL